MKVQRYYFIFNNATSSPHHLATAHGGYILAMWGNMMFYAMLHIYKIGMVAYKIPSYSNA